MTRLPAKVKHFMQDQPYLGYYIAALITVRYMIDLLVALHVLHG